MRTEHFIALDVHCTTTDMAVMTRRGRLTERLRCRTAIPPLVEAIRGIRRPRYLTFEEGPLADWLLRNLSPHADEVLVCQPRCNQLIAKDSDKDDRFQKVPGVKWIRGATFYAYLDTPWRFHGKSPLWRYLGIGLERKHSGSSPMHVRVSRQANRPLKDMILGAATTAIAQANNPFAKQYQHWIEKGGLSTSNARRNVARSLATTLWGMWKNGSEYRPEWVTGRV